MQFETPRFLICLLGFCYFLGAQQLVGFHRGSLPELLRVDSTGCRWNRRLVVGCNRCTLRIRSHRTGPTALPPDLLRKLLAAQAVPAAGTATQKREEQ